MSLRRREASELPPGAEPPPAASSPVSLTQTPRLGVFLVAAGARTRRRRRSGGGSARLQFPGFASLCTRHQRASVYLRSGSGGGPARFGPVRPGSPSTRLDGRGRASAVRGPSLGRSRPDEAEATRWTGQRGSVVADHPPGSPVIPRDRGIL